MVRIEREKAGNLVSTYVSDKLTKEDYDKILPALQQTVNEWDGVRWYFEMRDFSGWEPIAALRDLKFDIEHANELTKIAMVGTQKWQEWLTKAMKPFTSAEVRFFDLLEREEALRWIKS
ncbi:SpoIIAA family protein [Nafulsella turpanensis]|uniref:STAS/SEC14 domain-containing protein n=1 Tax=Nafulsella turpanensis TaxID=1265690 RepID=UPI00034BEC86|nr:STAS/SEC14 domain-containing protein [Nafulsella turpanensis]